MKILLKELWRQDRKNCLCIVIMQFISSLMGGVGIVMLLPMLELLDISAGATGGMAKLFAPLERIPAGGRALVMVGIYIGLIVFKALLNRALTIRQTEFIEGYTLKLRDRLYDAVSHASWQQLAHRRQAETIDLFTVQCSRVSNTVSYIIGLMSSLASAGIQMAIACWMSLPVTLVVCLAGCLLLAIFIPLRKKSRKYGEEMIRISREFYGELFNQLNAVKEVRTYGVEDEHAERYGKLSTAFRDTQMKFAHLRTLPNIVYSVAAAALISLVFIFSVIVMDMETARLMVLVLVFSRLWPPFSSWQGTLQNIQTNLPALEKLNEAIREMTESASEQTGSEGIAFAHKVSFENVNFRYQDGEESVLQSVNFTLEHGKITALVGRSGAGKSTVADLLMGFLAPESGSICVDGTPLTKENIRAWRKYIGYIPQSPLIINASVRENLSRFHPDATEADMIEALKKSVAWQFVEKLPQGLDTVLGDQGVRLSGGERQRIVLARVLMSKPKLIILDEATSALDYESENAVRDVLKEMRSETAILVIAHRLATVMIADQAVVLENGTVTESGSFKALTETAGGYLASMVNME